MQGVRRKDTGPEVSLRSALHRLGLRFRKDCRPLPALRCTADIVFRSRKVCVFVDGCFWHGCPQHCDAPKTNAPWWREKLALTIRRDRDRTRTLRDAGWTVIRLWEHDLAESHLDAAAELVRATVDNRL
jgi:DNA mismatch endonuclease (patch repair protein)